MTDVFTVGIPSVGSLSIRMRPRHPLDGDVLAWDVPPAWWDDHKSLEKVHQDLVKFITNTQTRLFLLGGRDAPAEHAFWENAAAELRSAAGPSLRVRFCLLLFPRFVLLYSSLVSISWYKLY